jgi:5,10-methylenetetrahydromethanopterin reductase
MQQHGVDWQHRKPLSRLKEAIHVMRTFFDDGAITFEGDFFTYNGLFTFARPVQQPLPIRMGGMKGPRSYEAAGELADGLHTALAYSPEAYEYVAKHVRIGCERAGRDFDSYDLGAWVVTVVSEDSAAAKHAARILCAFYISAMPDELVVRNGLDPADLAPVVEALGQGDVPKAVELFRPEFAEKLSVAGTPDEVVEKIRRDIQPSGVNHMVLALSDAPLVKAFSGEDVPNVPSVSEQLRLVAERVVPAFEPAVA